MRLLLTRPEAGPGEDPLPAALVAEGHDVLQAPLLTIDLTGSLPSLSGVQALIATSRNGLRAISTAPLPEAALALPLFAVGPATAALGRELGFHRVIEGTTGARDLVALVQSHAAAAGGTLLHLSGDTSAFDLGRALAALGFDVRREVVYQTRAADRLEPDVALAIGEGRLDGVVLMSPRTARVYADLVQADGLADTARGLVHYCLSPAVAAGLAALGPRRIAVARLPNSQEMLAEIARPASDSPFV